MVAWAATSGDQVNANRLYMYYFLLKPTMSIAAFEATMLIALYGKWPLEKNSHVKGSPTMHEIVLP